MARYRNLKRVPLGAGGSNFDVAEAWMKQTVAKRNGLYKRSSNGSSSFQGDLFFSYTTPIARRLEKERVVLCTDYSHSVTTTGKHLNAVARAARRDSYQIFFVPTFMEVSINHEENLTKLLSHYYRWFDILLSFRAHLDAGQWRRNAMKHSWDRALAYRSTFRVTSIKMPSYEHDVQRIERVQAHKKAKYSSPKAVERRTYQKAKSTLKKLVFG